MAHLDYVESFIREVYEGGTSDPSSMPRGPVFFRKAQGAVVLSAGSGQTYREVMARLEAEFSAKMRISRGTLRTYVQDALFASLGGANAGSDNDFESRLSAALGQLGRSLHKPPKDYVCYTPVRGLGVEGLPLRVGAVTLIRMNPHRLRRQLSPVLAASRGTREANRALLSSVESDLLGLPMALANVTAHDAGAAQDVALDETRLAIDVLNFFSDQIPNSPAWLYLPGEAGAEGATSLIVCEGESASVPGEWKGPLGEMSMKRLKSVPRNRRALKQMNELLVQTPRTRTADLILTSVRWAGRASVEPVSEHAFVMFMVALEALMLPHDSRDLANRLQTRVSHLLGANAADRGWLYDNVKHLYEVRSNIVHEGFVEVEDSDLTLLGMIVKDCIFRVILHRTAHHLSTPKTFSRWLDTHR